ncbi:MAG: hypothetical protein H7A34_09165 [bacterium]|nr:hypothetical protein [bacterium]
MTQQKRYIPNPNKISNNEQDFIENGNTFKNLTENANKKDKYRGRMISMSDSFYEQLNAYLKKHPTEGSRSSFIVRVVAEYINNKQ